MERAEAPHAGTLALYRALIRLRRTEPVLRSSGPFEVVNIADAGLVLLRGTGREWLLSVVWLRGAGVFDASRWPSLPAGLTWRRALSTEERRFQATPGDDDAGDGLTIELGSVPRIEFRRPGAVVFKGGYVSSFPLQKPARYARLEGG